MQRIGVFKARSGNSKRKERIIHAPDETQGEFVLYRKLDGTLIYQPVKQ